MVRVVADDGMVFSAFDCEVPELQMMVSLLFDSICLAVSDGCWYRSPFLVKV